MAQQLEALLLFSEGRREEALVLARQAAVVEAGLPFEFGPPVPVKPVNEQVGEMLMDLRRPKEAMEAFELSLKRNPKRRAVAARPRPRRDGGQGHRHRPARLRGAARDLEEGGQDAARAERDRSSPSSVVIVWRRTLGSLSSRPRVFPRRVRVGVLGAGTWAQAAHLPGFARDARCELVAIADPQPGLAESVARSFGIAHVCDSHEALIGRNDLDLVDVCTPSHTHLALSWAALEAGHHVLCEKPVAFDFRDTRRAAEFARAKGLKTKLGFTFRYAPAMRYFHKLVADGFVGTPFIFNGYEQNSQWLNPMTPLRQVDPDLDPAVLHVSSLEGYGAPIIDISHLMVGADLTQVVGTMRNFIPDRMVRATGKMQRMNIDDGDIYMGEFANGALCSIQTSYVTVGNYPGIEARLYGSEGAIICRLVEEHGICERLWLADQHHVEFKRAEIPAEFYPPGGSAEESWRTLFYANLVSSFITEILADDGSNEGNFDDGAWVQETINAVERSFRERRWVTLPLE